MTVRAISLMYKKFVKDYGIPQPTYPGSNDFTCHPRLAHAIVLRTRLSALPHAMSVSVVNRVS